MSSSFKILAARSNPQSHPQAPSFREKQLFFVKFDYILLNTGKNNYIKMMKKYLKMV